MYCFSNLGNAIESLMLYRSSFLGCEGRDRFVILPFPIKYYLIDINTFRKWFGNFMIQRTVPLSMSAPSAVRRAGVLFGIAVSHSYCFKYLLCETLFGVFY